MEVTRFDLPRDYLNYFLVGCYPFSTETVSVMTVDICVVVELIHTFEKISRPRPVLQLSKNWIILPCAASTVCRGASRSVMERLLEIWIFSLVRRRWSLRHVVALAIQQTGISPHVSTKEIVNKDVSRNSTHVPCQALLKLGYNGFGKVYTVHVFLKQFCKMARDLFEKNLQIKMNW